MPAELLGPQWRRQPPDRFSQIRAAILFDFSSDSPSLLLQGDVLCVLLSRDDQFGCQEALLLVLCHMCAVHHIRHKLRPERQRHAGAVNVPGLLSIYQEKVVALVLHGHIGVLANLDISVSAQDEEAAVAPRPQPIGREPIQTNVAKTTISAQNHVAEILKTRIIRVPDIGDLRLHNLCLCRSSVEKELIDLVRANVAEDSAVLVRVPEPVGPARAAAGDPAVLEDLVRRDVDGLDNFADRALMDEVSRIDGGSYLKPFAVHDGVDPLGLGYGFAHFGKLIARRDAGLVGEKVLALFHGAHAERSPFVGDLRAKNELNRGIAQDLFPRFDDPDVRKSFSKARQFVRLPAPSRNKFTAASLDGADHAVDMVVAHSADS